jgi:hypothetical protein
LRMSTSALNTTVSLTWQVQGMGVQWSEFGVQGLECKALGLGFRV